MSEKCSPEKLNVLFEMTQGNHTTYFASCQTRTFFSFFSYITSGSSYFISLRLTTLEIQLRTLM